MTGLDRLRSDEAGVVGKLIVGWLIAVVVIGIIGLDVVSVAFTHFKLADQASAVATVAATNYRGSQDTREACEAAASILAVDDPEARFTKQGCLLNSQTGQATITLRKNAETLIAERFGFTKHYARVTATATEGPATL